MSLLTGNYFIEHCLQGEGNKVEVLQKIETGPLKDAVIGDLLRLAQMGMRSYWTPIEGKLSKRHKLSKAVPNLIIIRTTDNEEIARWSLDDERNATGCS